MRRLTGVRARRRVVAAALVAALAFLPAVVAAHGGAGASESQQHLVADVFGFLVLAFVAYISVAFTRRVVYPRVRDALSR